ncbi:MAG: DUF3108 domain-containing protein [Hellea sp.]|nr:DUF3108 domain-containing protein [Hellea sp.]
MKRFYTGLAALILMGGPALLGAPVFADEPKLEPDAKFTAPLDPKHGETAFDVELKGSVFGLKIMKARLKGTMGRNKYRVYTDLKTSGLAAMFKKQRMWSTTAGRYDRTGIHPVRHVQQNLNKKARRVVMNFNYDEPSVDIKVRPPHGSQGTPPATLAQKFTSDDVNSALLKMIMTGYEIKGEVCQDDIKVFDSKQHYNLRMERVEDTTYKYDGTRYPAIKCHIYYEPISGFDAEDLPDDEEASAPVKAYFINRPDLGIYMPVKFTYKISGFKATIKVKDAIIIKGKELEKDQN